MSNILRGVKGTLHGSEKSSEGADVTNEFERTNCKTIECVVKLLYKSLQRRG